MARRCGRGFRSCGRGQARGTGWGATGMMAGHGGGDSAVGGPARHIPVLLAEVLAALAAGRRRDHHRRHLRRGRLHEGDPRGRRVGHRDRPRPRRRSQAGRALEDDAGRQAAAGARRFLATRRGRRERPTASCSTSASPRCRSTRPSAASRSASTGRSTCAWRRRAPSAADVVNRFKSADLARIFGFLGEERQAGRIARMIEKRRDEAAVRAHARPRRRHRDAMSAASPSDKIHPATRVFQALRIFVNDELGELAEALFAAERVLKPGGRLVVVTFHSLEDRIVKRFIADRSGDAGGLAAPAGGAVPGAPPSRSWQRGASAGEAEADANPRARSARLRAAVRTDAPRRAQPTCRMFGLPGSPEVRMRREVASRVFRTIDIVLIAVMVVGGGVHLQDQARGRGPASRACASSSAQIRFEEETDRPAQGRLEPAHPAVAAAEAVADLPGRARACSRSTRARSSASTRLPIEAGRRSRTCRASTSAASRRQRARRTPTRSATGSIVQ